MVVNAMDGAAFHVGSRVYYDVVGESKRRGMSWYVWVACDFEGGCSLCEGS